MALDLLNNNATLHYLIKNNEEKGTIYRCNDGKISQALSYKEILEEKYNSKFEPYDDPDNPNSVCELMKIKPKSFKAEEYEYNIQGIFIMDGGYYVVDDKNAYEACIDEVSFGFFDSRYNHVIFQPEYLELNE